MYFQSESLENEIRRFLLKYYNNVSRAPQELFEKLNQLTRKQRRGIWEESAQNLGIQASDVRNYYHNTWIKQFYDPVAPMMEELGTFIVMNRNKKPYQIACEF